MAVRVLEAGHRVVLEAPLGPNVNHRSTAFGGSVAALAILAGWTLTDLRLRRDGIGARTVIQTSSVRFDAPIEGPFLASCGPVDPDGWARLCRALERRGRGRIKIQVEIRAAGELAGVFEGAYVALAASDTEELR